MIPQSWDAAGVVLKEARERESIGVATVIAVLGMPATSAKRLLNRLESEGLIYRITENERGGRGRRTLYRLNPDVAE